MREWSPCYGRGSCNRGKAFLSVLSYPFWNTSTFTTFDPFDRVPAATRSPTPRRSSWRSTSRPAGGSCDGRNQKRSEHSIFIPSSISSYLKRSHITATQQIQSGRTRFNSEMELVQSSGTILYKHLRRLGSASMFTQHVGYLCACLGIVQPLLSPLFGVLSFSLSTVDVGKNKKSSHFRLSLAKSTRSRPRLRPLARPGLRPRRRRLAR